VDSASISDRVRARPWLAGVLFLVATTTVGAGCARAVLPSEKAYLADPIMQFDPDGLEASADAHFHVNREGASGGTGTKGGGCGCN
jgi:hypothetical protein